MSGSRDPGFLDVLLLSEGLDALYRKQHVLDLFTVL